MCGRTACTLQPDDIRRCCAYVNRRGKRVIPSWNNSDNYKPCYNLGPTKYSPVLVSKKHVDPSSRESDDRIVDSMSWGLHVHGLFNQNCNPTMVINARCETLLEKPTFKTPLNAGKRCVILADGYYEWHRQGKVKSPYFIHLPQPDDVNLHNEKTWKKVIKEEEDDDWNLHKEAVKYPKLLAMAGIFDKIKGAEEKTGYVVITVPASQATAHIHDRMPAILEGDDAINDWLDYGSINAKQAVEQLKPVTNVRLYRVSPFVNNIRNDAEECVRVYTPPSEKPNPSKSFMENWIKRSAPKDTTTEDSKPPIKKERKH